ncbi:hypothetical protein AMIS_44830 [Actinoplanes missouriensis 431]|uniref:MmpS family membrane protein n=1 Tax=Actinoplanes missouriensis (strain ATCC 14538 / DSM 43046 / CBS 188.64 / JCM 3121 / NBRC 102363 / NCIMB 12654 / NRRL B-3342 / UNCC 431) TaxID=512565 RepID=I0H9L6_ACTM4|nr:MmpS family transport accessory protein [Actinoplanes missouriensis]BAL89703.1 hypothetical protein AMIS_44830 [Actinoplanes missouriensis 431]
MVESGRTPYRKIALGVVAAIVLAGIVATVVALRGGGTEVRYEVETSSGSAVMITYTTADGEIGMHRAETAEGTVSTPWSATVTFEEPASLVSVTTDTGDPTATGTCRIFVDDTKIADSSDTAGAMCEAQVP